MLKTINIDKSIEGKSILKSCSVELNDSKIIGLVGINGAGKTTLMKCMSGIYNVDNGSVELDDKDIFTNPETKNNIFLVFISLVFLFVVSFFTAPFIFKELLIPSAVSTIALNYFTTKKHNDKKEASIWRTLLFQLMH